MEKKMKRYMTLLLLVIPRNVKLVLANKREVQQLSNELMLCEAQVCTGVFPPKNVTTTLPSSKKNNLRS